MPQLLSFTCPELNQPYEAVYTELAVYLELDLETTVKRFAPDDAVARVRYFRRQNSRRTMQPQLAELLGVDAEVVFQAVTEEGARLLYEGMTGPRKQVAPTLDITTRVARPDELIDELVDLMAR